MNIHENFICELGILGVLSHDVASIRGKSIRKFSFLEPCAKISHYTVNQFSHSRFEIVIPTYGQILRVRKEEALS